MLVRDVKFDKNQKQCEVRNVSRNIWDLRLGKIVQWSRPTRGIHGLRRTQPVLSVFTEVDTIIFLILKYFAIFFVMFLYLTKVYVEYRLISKQYEMFKAAVV